MNLILSEFVCLGKSLYYFSFWFFFYFYFWLLCLSCIFIFCCYDIFVYSVVLGLEYLSNFLAGIDRLNFSIFIFCILFVLKPSILLPPRSGLNYYLYLYFTIK